MVLTDGLDNHEGHSIRIGDMVDWVTRYNMQGQATSLPALNTARNHHACGTIKKSDGATVRSQRSGGSWRVFFIEFPVLYRVRWGRLGFLRDLHGDSGEGGRILLSWQMVASLPSARGAFRGVSLPNGHFMVSGEVQRCPCFIYGT